MKQSGFSLIELIIALAIIGILVVIAYPSYKTHLEQARRSDGQTALLDLANRLDHYFSENNHYTGATLAELGVSTRSTEGYYTLAITSLEDNAFRVEAIPIGAQQKDACGTLSWNQLGERGFSGTKTELKDCW